MIIKEAEYKECGECGSRELVRDEQYGCDQCRKPIPLYNRGKGVGYLDITVFYDVEQHSDDFHFCSWKCCLLFIKNVKCDYFTDFPVLRFDEPNDNLNYKGFIKAIQEFK